MAYIAFASTVEPLKQRHGGALGSILGKWYVLPNLVDYWTHIVAAL
jgi:hypothetical protein